MAAWGDSPGASTATEMTGMAAGSMRWTIGSSISRGSWPRMAATLPRMSWAATWVELPMWKMTTMFESPSCEVDSMVLTPSTVLTASSMRLVTSRSTVSGLAPG